MEERERLEAELKDTLAVLKERIDSTFAYLNDYPEDTERTAKLWSDTVREFLNYGMKKSDVHGGDNLFKRITRMFIFGR